MRAIKLFFAVYFAALLGVCTLTYAGVEPATMEAFKQLNIPGIGAVYRIAVVNGALYLAGEPTLDALLDLKKLDIKTVINLCPVNEIKFDEANALKKISIKYINIPVDIAHFDVNNIKQFNAAITEPKNFPIFVHCHTANRPAMMVVFNNITEGQTSADMAIDEAKQYGLTKPDYIEFIKQTAKRYNLVK